MGRFFKIFPNLSQNWLKSNKIYEKSGDFAQYLAQNWFDWYMNGSLFLEKLVFVWVYFQIPLRHIPTKTKLEYPPGLSIPKICQYLNLMDRYLKDLMLITFSSPWAQPEVVHFLISNESPVITSE